MQKKYKLTAYTSNKKKVFSISNIDAIKVFDIMVGRDNFTFKIESIK